MITKQIIFKNIFVLNSLVKYKYRSKLNKIKTYLEIVIKIRLGLVIITLKMKVVNPKTNTELKAQTLNE